MWTRKCAVQTDKLYTIEKLIFCSFRGETCHFASHGEKKLQPLTQRWLGNFDIKPHNGFLALSRKQVDKFKFCLIHQTAGFKSFKNYIIFHYQYFIEGFISKMVLKTTFFEKKVKISNLGTLSLIDKELWFTSLNNTFCKHFSGISG